MRRKSKAIALSTTGLGLAVLTACIWVTRERILGEWYLRELRTTEDKSIALNAAMHLTEMQAERAIPLLFPLARKHATTAFVEEPITRMGNAALPPFLELMGQAYDDPLEARTGLFEALASLRIDGHAESVLVRALYDSNAHVRDWAAYILSTRLPAITEAARPRLLELLNASTESDFLKRCAAEALSKIAKH